MSEAMDKSCGGDATTKPTKSGGNGKSGSNKNNQKGRGNGGKGKNQYRGKQGRKDSKSPRVNADNERESKFVKQYEKDGMRQTSSDAANDISWYSKNPELLKAAASFPFASVLGNQIRETSPQYIPGLMVLPFSFAVGGFADNMYSDGIPDEYGFPIAINQAGKSNYSFQVHANSRNYVYEYQDLMMVEMAGIQVFAAIAHVVRAFAFAKTYAERSIYKPEAYLLAMGFDPTDFRNNLGQIWFDINQLIAQTAQIWIPSEAPLLKRWIWMCSNIFTDSASALGQNYIFVPRYFWQFSETGDTNGTSLEVATYNTGTNWSPFIVTGSGSNAYHQWSAWMGMIQHMIDRLVNSEDRGVMFGDILNAYGAQRVFAMPSIDVNLRLEPVFQPEVLTQIENSTITSCDVVGLRQSPQGIYPCFKGVDISNTSNIPYVAQRIAPRTPVLNFHQMQNPTPEQIMIATRLMSAGTVSTSKGFTTNSSITDDIKSAISPAAASSAQLVPLYCGSEIIHDMYFVVKSSTSNFGWGKQSYPWAKSVPIDDVVPFDTERMIPGDYLSFDWAPFIYWMSNPNSAEVPTMYGQVLESFGDYDNYIVVNGFELTH